MEPKEKFYTLKINLQHVGLAMLLSLLSWMLVDKLIIEISFWKYILVEIILVVIHTFYKFVTSKSPKFPDDNPPVNPL
jgi:hypothetical protein